MDSERHAAPFKSSESNPEAYSTPITPPGIGGHCFRALCRPRYSYPWYSGTVATAGYFDLEFEFEFNLDSNSTSIRPRIRHLPPTLALPGLSNAEGQYRTHRPA